MNQNLALTSNSSLPLRYDGTTDAFTLAMRRVGLRIKQISEIFATIFGPSAVPVNRVRPILAGQMANSYTVEQGLALIREGLNVTSSSVLYAIAGAPYIFPSAVPDGGADEVSGLTVDQLVSGLAQGITIAPMPARTHTVAGRACPRGTVFAWWRTRAAGISMYVQYARL